MGSIARGSGFWWRHKGYGCEKRLSGLGLVVKGLVEFQKVYFSHLYILDIDVYIFRCRNLCFSFVYIPICLFIPLFYLFIIVFLFFLTQSLSWYWQKVQRNNDKLKKKEKKLRLTSERCYTREPPEPPEMFVALPCSAFPITFINSVRVRIVSLARAVVVTVVQADEENKKLDQTSMNVIIPVLMV